MLVGAGAVDFAVLSHFDQVGVACQHLMVFVLSGHRANERRWVQGEILSRFKTESVYGASDKPLPNLQRGTC